MTSYTVEHLAQLKALAWLLYQRRPRHAARYKDADRFFKMLEVWQASVEWDDSTCRCRRAPLRGAARRPPGDQVEAATSTEAHENWSSHARVFVRDTEELMDEIYPRRMASHPDWMASANTTTR